MVSSKKEGGDDLLVVRDWNHAVEVIECRKVFDPLVLGLGLRTTGRSCGKAEEKKKRRGVIGLHLRCRMKAAVMLGISGWGYVARNPGRSTDSSNKCHETAIAIRTSGKNARKATYRSSMKRKCMCVRHDTRWGMIKAVWKRATDARMVEEDSIDFKVNVIVSALDRDASGHISVDEARFLFAELLDIDEVAR